VRVNCVPAEQPVRRAGVGCISRGNPAAEENCPDLTSVRGAGEVYDGRVFGLTGAMLDEGAVFVRLPEIDGILSFGQQPIWIIVTRIEIPVPVFMPLGRNSQDDAGPRPATFHRVIQFSITQPELMEANNQRNRHKTSLLR
jgi:hypothetical protein